MMEDSEEEYDEDDENDAVFEAPAVQHQESSFQVLTPAECEAAARQAVQSVVDLLCCEEDAAQILLRRYKWDQDRLTDGAPACALLASCERAPPKRRARARAPSCLAQHT